MSRAQRIVRNVTMLAAGLLFLWPIVFMVEVSLQREGTGLMRSIPELVGDVHPENYREALTRMGNFPLLFWNTVMVTVLSILGQLLTTSLAGYAFARVPFRGRDALFTLVLATMLLPDQVTAIPRFLLFRVLGMVDTFQPLILPTVLGGAPFFIFLFRQYFLSLPSELSDAARVDGCGHWRIWWHIMLPLARPMLATVGIFTFLAAWNDFWNPLIYILLPERQTLTLALAGFNRTYNTAVEHMMAASAVVLAPCVIVYFLAQKLFLRGVEVAASKR